MKHWVIGLLLPASAYAGAFDFKDADGFEKCMRLDHLVESVKTGSGYETRLLAPEEIQPRCVAAATALVTSTKDKALATACIAITKREAGPELALDLIDALVTLALPPCNDMENYEVLMRPISSGYETDWGKKKAIPIIRKCLKDADFKKDFLEEKDSGDERRAANACQILLSEKLVKGCKK